MNAHQPAEATIEDAEAPLVIGDLDESLDITIVVGTNDPVRVRVDLVDSARRHLQTHRLPRVTPVVLKAVVALFSPHRLKHFSHMTLKSHQTGILARMDGQTYSACYLSF